MKTSETVFLGTANAIRGVVYMLLVQQAANIAFGGYA